MDIKFLYETTDKTIQQIADELNSSYKKVFNFIKKNYSIDFRKSRKAICYQNSKLGILNPQKKQKGLSKVEFVSDNKGYRLLLKPTWYQARRNSKHVFYHHVVVCENLNLTSIPSGWCVHHCDGNKVNNDFSNLVLMKIIDHCKLHQMLKGATTISKESTLKWVEAHGTIFNRDDIVSSTQECVAVNNGQELTTPVEDKGISKTSPQNVSNSASQGTTDGGT